jgi:hypothetical protein
MLRAFPDTQILAIKVDSFSVYKKRSPLATASAFLVLKRRIDGLLDKGLLSPDDFVDSHYDENYRGYKRDYEMEMDIGKELVLEESSLGSEKRYYVDNQIDSGGKEQDSRD